ncbi:metalloregulator ArsR/SmtB family transcription factor [Lactiplantibacillus plantarum]|uniref:ArsR/SmtB family transcription factor n=1 Tax=Lactiplantibacillus plantarum TaxID=1590 RepID=UPI002001C5AC|nr:metalloregulator ArsR/SmtB family transcription factor [Lactiplantibacillus plantarum]MCK3677711.1 metalloregulator ArsR/SmtB family transcription factor [Lactiplantibacillus plantarum]WQC50607.1 metalloregulator ArsR/SmtB family transcription factor [Lactiplantibacillus plantarum]WQG53922.1 metalloregulator ArsR/SmtB family transcription factor [Lactiplantibacillus plantarum]
MENEMDHEMIVKRLAELMPPTDELSRITAIFKALGDPTRARIIYALAVSKLSVGELATGLVLTQSNVSHQLTVLKQLKLVVGTRNGRNVHYQLADKHIISIFQQVAAHAEEADN